MRSIFKLLALLCAILAFFTDSAEEVVNILLIEVILLWLVVLYDDIKLLNTGEDI